MNIIKGDRVKFLNTTGGGIVIKVLNQEMVSVLEDDGFEYPVLKKECVVVDRPKVSSEESEEVIFYEEQEGGDELQVLLAFVPSSEKMEDFDFYLINDSNYFLFYVLSSYVGGEKLSLSYQGELGSNVKSKLSSINIKELNGLEKLQFQCLAFKKEKEYTLQEPINKTIKLKTIRFFQKSSFTENDYFESNALLVSLLKEEKIVFSKEALLQSFFQKKEETVVVKKSKPNSNKNDIIEVDLHMHELIDDFSGLQALDCLAYQLKKFEEVMQENKKKKGQRIVFIHGKGNGVLRNEIILLLKKNYSSCTYQDASFKEYGFGATMITVR